MGGLLRHCAFVLFFYGLAVVLGAVVLVALFKSGLLAAVSILFYRGLALVAAGLVITFIALGVTAAAMRRGLGPRDAFAASVLSASLNLCFLVVFPVTIDRSQTLFILGEMSTVPEQSVSPREVRDFFVNTYVDDYRQMDRRLEEQTISGNIEKTAQGYRITQQGRAVIGMSRTIAGLFDIDPRFINPPPLTRRTPQPAGR
ncbi:MAG: hypothetical protein ABIO39_03175 [Caulobacteraceae bacterium]